MALAPAQIKLDLIDEKVKFKLVAQGNPEGPVVMDYPPPLGSGEGYTGIDMLVMSFAGCVSTAILGLLKRKGKHVGFYAMEATGIKHEEPLYLEAIRFTAKVGGEEITEGDLAEVLALAEKISPAWIALRGNVDIDGEILRD